jgi:hypothetical protein
MISLLSGQVTADHLRHPLGHGFALLRAQSVFT